MALLFLAGNAAAAGNKPQNCPLSQEPEEVIVQGVVEVLNDALYQPFVVSGGVTVDPGSTTGSVTFDIPAGKRLVIETITVQVAVTSGVPRVFFEPLVGTTRPLSLLSLAANEPETATARYFIGTHPFKARLDGTAEATDEIRIRFGNGFVGGSMNATVYGYLLNL